ncbi:TPA: ASCH domain-containing protein [Salmonella enterica]|nr:ASCH domain-containing protein [Salmonella enterica subsp. enterica serovar Newport]HAF2584533.1 ASCH domain-containing protein [Salmonella enterica]
MKVLLSIKPEFAEKILDGSKRFEFRKGIFKNRSINTVVIYATMPLGKVVGQFSIESILSDAPEDLWIKTQKYAGISKTFFDNYYSGRSTAYAIKVGDVERFETPLPLSALGDRIKAPQSYLYL